ncbi:hypothetical protein L198_06594 [Cryptococcus wingfieldii CBS 7118]|uniref:Uncharacterized protein n=1 Tax=Cryptococcus wingfieldii CBS 7118 TaxID=1295528 RepID=A0A1E3IJM1_9TREE|nr:hypothetical protein L198_06594 [Cryptococcus wingfieldii CBS 7118]ODN88792.1 hypothetical protein L198_06594 [Cryptococcus wingfieldii CBS 7118]
MNDEHDHPSLCWMLLASLGACFVRSDDPEREPLFPPPTTILTQPSAHPSARARPTLPNLLSFTTSSRSRSRSTSQYPSVNSSPTRTTGPLSGGFGSERDGTVSSRKREDAGRRMDSISKAFAGRMQPLEQSLPSTPSTARGLRPLSSTLTLSHPSALSLSQQHHQPPSPLSPRPTHPTRSQTTSVPNNRPSAYEPCPYGATLPHRPSAPNLGRSISEPWYLADLAATVKVDFAETQIPKYGPLIVYRLSRAGVDPSSLPHGDRPFGKGRVRSATTMERLTSPWEASRGRDREPSMSTMVREPSFDGSTPSPTKTHHSGSSLGTRSMRAGGERSLSKDDSLNLSLEGSRQASPLPSTREYPDGEGYFAEDGEEEEGVVKRDLGLSVLYQKQQKRRPKSKGKKRVSS